MRNQAVIYCRVSSYGQAIHGNSLASQVEDCLEFCKKKGLDVVAVFSEVGSGDAGKTSRLPARHQAVHVALNRNAVVVCTCLDRFSRESCKDMPYLEFAASDRLIEVWKCYDLINRQIV